MKFLVDENVPQTIIRYLRVHGHDTTDVKRTVHRSDPDQRLLELAAVEDRILLTFDKDFVTPVYLPQNAAIVVLHFPRVRPADVLPKIEQLLDALTRKQLKRPYRIILQEQSVSMLSE
ncbi:MAG: DUF5615 family PIN-like protein [Patescibacteria group bacterium]